MKLLDYIVALHINAMTDNLPQRRRGLVLLLVSKQAKPVAHFFEPSVTVNTVVFAQCMNL